MSDRDARPQTVACPACFASANEPCNVPTDTGRRPVGWTHWSRQNAANAVAAARPVPEPDTGGYMVLGDNGVTLHDDMREAEAVAVVEHGAVYAITLHRDYRG